MFWVCGSLQSWYAGLDQHFSITSLCNFLSICNYTELFSCRLPTTCSFFAEESNALRTKSRQAGFQWFYFCAFSSFFFGVMKDIERALARTFRGVEMWICDTASGAERKTVTCGRSYYYGESFTELCTFEFVWLAGMGWRQEEKSSDADGFYNYVEWLPTS